MECLMLTVSRDRPLLTTITGSLPRPHWFVANLPEEVADLIRRALKVIPPERLIVSTDCGFGRQGMSRLHAFYKMVSLVRGTNIVRRELGLPEADVLAADPAGSLI
jgi:hypothetical protein